ncbi:MAG: WD40/YVTN/BNR-like repeat-containing protein [Bacteroidota bacterium]
MITTIEQSKHIENNLRTTMNIQRIIKTIFRNCIENAGAFRTICSSYFVMILLIVVYFNITISQETKHDPERKLSTPLKTQVRPVDSLNKMDQGEQEDDPNARELYRYKQRVGGDGTIPPNALIKAKQQIDQMRAMMKKSSVRTPFDAGITGWEWLGPGNIGGRIRSILISPTNSNTMWIGSVSGGIWRTDNGGTSWYPINDFMANLAVTSIVMDPIYNNIMYAATGEGFGNVDGVRGAGIFKSIDGGITWNQLPSTANPQFYMVMRLSHHPSATNILLAATSTGVYRSNDGGVSWNLMLGIYAEQVKYHPTNPNRVLCGGSSDFYLSNDGGLNWRQQDTAAANKLPVSTGRCEGDFARSDNTVYVNMDRNGGEVWRSQDGGITWSHYSIDPSKILGTQGGYDNVMWVDPTNSNVILAGYRNLQLSRDGGQTFTIIGGASQFSPAQNVHSDMHMVAPSPQYDGIKNKTIFIGCDGGIYKAVDITVATLSSGWTDLNNNLGITQFYTGAAATDGSLIAGAAQDNDRVQYTPGGGINGWYGAVSGKGGDGTGSVIDFTNPQRVYAEATSLNIERSDDGGKNYSSKTNGISDAGLWVSPLVMDPNNASTLFAGGSQIWKTTNAADSWSQFRKALSGNPLCSAIGIAHGNSNVIWVGYSDGTVSRTLDGGSTWTDVNTNAMPLFTTVTSVAINPYNSNEVFVTFGQYSTGRVWMTSDTGITWFNRSGTGSFSLPAIQINSITYHPQNDNWIYVGTDLGIFASENKGATWKITPLYGSNEGPANVEIAQLFWQGTEYLIAATHGRGMFRSHPLTVVWVDVSNPNPGNGTLLNPFNTVGAALNAAGPGTEIDMKGGTYNEGILAFRKRGVVHIFNGPAIIK